MQLGTLSGNPVASVAGLKTMEILKRPGSYEHIRQCGKTIMKALTEHLSAAGIDHQVVGDPVLFDVVFTPTPVVDYRGVLRGNAKIARNFNVHLRQKGILKSDGKFYPSLALGPDEIAQTVDAIAYASKHVMDGIGD